MKKILIIEDEKHTRENLVTILEMEGYRPTAASDGMAGVAAARFEVPDLILCDVTMPKLDGFGVLAALRNDERTANVPFIFLTARGDRPDVRAGMNQGADDYLTKPASATEVLAAIETRLERQRRSQESAVRNATVSADFSSALPLESLGLTTREAEVLLWVTQGKSNGDVGTILSMSEKTVKVHLCHIFEKLNVETRTAAAMLAMEALVRTRAGPGNR
ncbi:MAG TPA: response regulator transcription factor [Candidatus Limnocylindria bacterium]|jgi:DNA-binding NarL/FixJ family response regulator|nr:response regulator transcription factor [Candidatus Limnocylindria bacterium]